ncbi:hypothetical protein EVJ50_10620 [Synechococcus sp. RSCCF101]|uniref:hypothetical protein n=1 Tax=Synechococcus sp. RSCCF101 TaxID=2511069 RepID=UPI0012452681|nr:hypothetical protein [Synechococcus sp. RSCCF101]QEY32606.1 hypothetical protein EVJ50_10620 [Synechococcus sp. RSCCF101]
MTYLLQLCGFSDPLRLFYLEQQQGPCYGGFRRFHLDDLMDWALAIASRRHWDSDLIEKAVMDHWLRRAEQIRLWQQRLGQQPSQQLLVAAIGTNQDWQRRCERLLEV